VIVDQILYDPDNTLQVGNVYTVGYGDDPKNIAAGDKIVVNGTYYHNCGPFGAYGRICGDLWKDLPDLIIEDIKWPSGTVCLGDRIPITVTVKNIGGDKANQSVVKYYVGNKYIDRDTVPSLVPNATSNQTFNWTANSCGNISVMAIADANHTVHECNESNNDKQKRIEASGPDLITHIWPIGTAGRVCLGEPITFTVTVINTGDCTAGQSVVKYYAGGEYIDSELIPSLSPGAASTQTFTWTASSCGNVSVRAVADASHEVRECDENNNDKAKSVKVDGPDMIIPDITLPSGKICLGQPVTITVTVKNEGGCTAGASTVKYFVDNKYVDSDSIPSLDPGAASSQTFTWTASSCGDVPVKAVADANNEVTECDENNNEKAKTVRVDGPDLIIEDIIVPTGKICLGLPVTITVTVKNQGGCPAGASAVKYFVDNKYVDSDSIPSLDPGASSTQTFTWTADSCGNVSVKGVADANNDVRECDENNNEKQKSIEVDGPDLIIQDITWPSGKICLDNEIEIEVTTANVGKCDAEKPFKVTLYIENKEIENATIASLDAGNKEKATFSWIPDTCGILSIKAVADVDNTINECDENNNEKQKSIEVDGPDLIIQNITWPSGKICLDNEIEIEVTTANVGKCDAEKPFKVTLYIENKEIENATIDSLGAGNQENTTFSWIPDTCGILSIKAVADVDNTIHECDENNNEKQKSIEVDGPDLIIQDITWPSGKICLDKEIEIEVTTANVGKCDAEKPFKVTLYVENKEIENATISFLGAGNQEKTTFSWKPDTCGILSIKAVADVDNTIHECDENNNEKQKSIEVDGPDLIIHDITWPSGKICLDKEIEIEVTTANVGKCDAEKPFKVTLYIENKAIENVTIASLGAGNQEKTTFSWIPDTCGILSIKAVADVDNTIHECDENNNEKQKSIEVDGPDLIIQEITWPSGTICLDHEIEIEVTTANVGKCDAEKPFKMKLYVESKEIGTATIDFLGAGDTEKTPIKWTPDTCGILSIKAAADVDNSIHECDENNNEKQKSIEVDGPDLIIQDISLPSGTICLNSPVNIEVTTANIGGCPATKQFTVMLYVASKELTATIKNLEAGATTKSTFDWIPDACGNHNLKAVADPNGDIHECNEGNNENQKDIKVEGPDLIVKEISPASDLLIGSSRTRGNVVQYRLL
jgi:subtilase family serine protease